MDSILIISLILISLYILYYLIKFLGCNNGKCNNLNKYIQQYDSNIQQKNMYIFDSGYFTTLLFWIGFILLFFSKNKIKIIIIVCVLIFSYILVIPWMNIYNLFISYFFYNKPMDLNKEYYFPESKILESNYYNLRKELDFNIKEFEAPCFNKIFPGVDLIAKEDKKCWRIIYIKNNDVFVKENISKFPILTKLIKGMPSVYNCWISILDKDTHIPGHRGPLKSFIRYHMGLKVNKNKKAFINCGGKIHRWENGKGVCFDDMYYHYVKNNTGSERIVLFIDVRRRFENKIMKFINNSIISLISNNLVIKRLNKNDHIPIKKKLN